jgi:hypothetical protein
LVGLITQEGGEGGAAALRDLVAVRAVFDALMNTGTAASALSGDGSSGGVNTANNVANLLSAFTDAGGGGAALDAMLAVSREIIEALSNNAGPPRIVMDAGDVYRESGATESGDADLAGAFKPGVSQSSAPQTGAQPNAAQQNSIQQPGAQQASAPLPGSQQASAAQPGAPPQPPAPINLATQTLAAQTAALDPGVAPAPGGEAPGGAATDFLFAVSGGAPEKLFEVIRANTIDLFTSVLSATAAEAPEPARADTAGRLFGELLFRDQILTPERLFGNPAETAELIKAQYERIVVQLGLLRASLISKQRNENSPERSEILRRIDSLEDGIRLMDNLNNRHQYIQAPLFVDGKETNLELFVMKRGGNKKKIDIDDATLFVSLNTNNIGRVEALIHTGGGKKISVDLRAGDEATLGLFREGRAELHNALADIGYKLVRTTYHVIEERLCAANAIKRANILFPTRQGGIDYRI